MRSRIQRLAAACRLVVPFILLSSIPHTAAAEGASISGTVTDQLGGPIAQAAIALVREGQQVTRTTSDSHGAFTLDGLTEGRYQLDVSAAGFARHTTDAVFVSAEGRAAIAVTLAIGPLTQQVVVTAAASAVPEAQAGAPVAVLDAATLDALGNTDLLEPLRTIPGVEIVQTGARGGATSMFVRGGASNFAKVLVDGVPANDIGGSFDLADLSTTGVERVEVLRGANSVLYGTDALTGVVNITSRRGRTRIPQAVLSLDGGNLGTSREDGSLGGAVRRVDYFGEFSHLQTDNSVANNAYRNNTLATRLGVMLGTGTSLSGTIRHINTTFGSPNAFDYYAVADDSSQARTTTYASIAAESQINNRWQSTIRFSVAHQNYRYANPAPTGFRSDPSAFANYLGNVVTITGANGYSVTGRAILDYGGTYPSTFDSKVTRRLVYGETSVHVTSALDVAGGARVENEHGTSGATSSTDRNNYGAFVEARGAAHGYLYVNGGLGFDRNEIFGTAWTPRVSAAAYLRRPTASSPLGDTKITFNVGKGIKEPSLFQELSSLFAVVPAAIAGSLGVQPVGPERSRAVDVGLEQGLAAGHGRLRVSYFSNTFDDLIEYVGKSVLPQLGVPVAAANASGFGAYVNSQSNTASGVELSGEAMLGHVKVTGSYLYLDATVTRSFSSGVLSPAVNPAFPGIKIGQYAPLVGAHPFRRPANSGSLVIVYSERKAQVALAGYFVGKQDDSTLLSDAFFGYSMLLPNADMDPANQKFDLSASYQLHRRLRWYVIVENVFDRRFEAAAGFPALPRAARTGVTIQLGGN